jgi:hypothetical protein
MRTLFAITCLAVTVIAASSLLLALMRVLRGKSVKVLRNTGLLAVMIFALWQCYLLKPALAVWSAYLCLPAAIAGALLILLSGADGMVSDEPEDGPERRIPAMAKRWPQARDEEEELKFAVGGRVA